eukprot:344807-Hanusia_phi.AAC.6
MHAQVQYEVPREVQRERVEEVGLVELNKQRPPLHQGPAHIEVARGGADVRDSCCKGLVWILQRQDDAQFVRMRQGADEGQDSFPPVVPLALRADQQGGAPSNRKGAVGGERAFQAFESDPGARGKNAVGLQDERDVVC